jgi:diguanylate cyclase (GGDEF)-like protein
MELYIHGHYFMGMQDITGYIINGLLLLGVCLLCASFYPIKSLTDQLPEGALRKRWSDVRALLLFFIAGYVSYTYLYWLKRAGDFELIVPAVFFFSAVLVLFIGKLAIETAAEIERISYLQHESITDPLIGIYNRRYLDRIIVQEFQRALRYRLPLSFFMLDIDHFKTINDRYGHPAGDQTLINLGQLLSQKVRETDIIARYGGEEIAILAVQTPLSNASILAERLRQAIESSIVVPAEDAENRPAIAITVSIGVAALDEQITSPHVLIERADKALYQAKEGGRNRVVVFDGNF